MFLWLLVSKSISIISTRGYINENDKKALHNNLLSSVATISYMFTLPYVSYFKYTVYFLVYLLYTFFSIFVISLLINK